MYHPNYYSHYNSLLLSLSLSDVLQIKYFNNKIICDLVEMQHTGVIALLDEACFLVGTVTDRVGQSSIYLLQNY